MIEIIPPSDSSDIQSSKSKLAIILDDLKKLLIEDIRIKSVKLLTAPDAARIRREEMGAPSRDLLLFAAAMVAYFINNVENQYESLRFLINLSMFIGLIYGLYRSVKAHEKAEERIRKIEEAELARMRDEAIIIDQNKQIVG